MQARYRKLYPRIWQHPRFHALSREARLVALYLLTGPQTNRIGYYRLSVGEALEDLVLTNAQFTKAMATVTKAMDWEWDASARVVWIRSWWRWNPPEAPNNLRGAFKDYYEVPASSLSTGFIETSRAVAERLGVPVPNPSRTGSVPLLNPSRTQDQEQDQDQEQQQQQEQEGTTTALTRQVDDGFDAFYTAYPHGPHNTGPMHAKKAWSRLRPDISLQAEILAALDRQKRWPQWMKDSGQFIPTPQKWLSEKRWLAPEPDRPVTSGKTSGNAEAIRQFLEGQSHVA